MAAAPRPYGRGPYGTGPYSRNRAHIYEVGGASLLLFGAKALGFNRVINPEALTQIVFDAWAEHLIPNWMVPGPCEGGTWQPAGPCLAAAWDAPDGCSTGAWTVNRIP